LEGTSNLIVSFFVVGKCKFVQKIGKLVIGLALLTFPVAVNPLLEILDALFYLVLFDAFVADEEVSATSFPIILSHD